MAKTMGKLNPDYIRNWVHENTECEYVDSEHRVMSNRKHWYVIVKCKCGRYYDKNFNDFKRKPIKTCLTCSGRDFHTYETVKHHIENELSDICGLRLKLIDKEYKSYDERLNIEDEYGYKYFVSYHHLISSIKRKDNFLRMVDITNPHSIYNIKLFALKQGTGYELLSNNYEGCYDKLKWRCDSNHECEIAWSRFYIGTRCTQCYNEKDRSGINHHNWKGGTSFINSYLRDYLDDWRMDSMKNCNFRCVVTNNEFSNVHHLYSFNLILFEVLQENNIVLKRTISEYTQEELRFLTNKVVEKHYKYPLGVCLSKEVHLLFHELYGLGNNTPEQFEEFKINYKNGLYRDLIQEVG